MQQHRTAPAIAQHLNFLGGGKQPRPAAASGPSPRCEGCRHRPQERRVSKTRSDGTYYAHRFLCLPCCGTLDAAVWTVGT